MYEANPTFSLIRSSRTWQNQIRLCACCPSHALWILMGRANHAQPTHIHQRRNGDRESEDIDVWRGTNIYEYMEEAGKRGDGDLPVSVYKRERERERAGGREGK